MKQIIEKHNYNVLLVGIIVIYTIFVFCVNTVKASQEVEKQYEVDNIYIGMAYNDLLTLDISSEGYLFGEQVTYQEAFELPKLTGDWREDIIAVAKSQLGYSEAMDGSTLFGAWAGDAKQHWCSEFASWCAYQAGIPETVFPKKRSSRAFQKYYAEEGRFYFLEGGISPEISGYGNSNAETISIDQLEPGDIILKETNGDYSNGADHTGLFIEIRNGKIFYISGNSNDSVEEKICPIETIHGICKPDYSVIKTGWQNINDKWYYLDLKSGEKKTGWKSINDKWYYLDERNGDMKVDWQYINGKWYYFDLENGNMKTGWINWNHKWYYMDKETGSCLINTRTPDGYLVDETGAWIS